MIYNKSDILYPKEIYYMTILVTGGCGFIGSHVAERFGMDGCRIVIIDNLSSGRIENISPDFKVYHLNIESPLCEQVFKEECPDIVIHLAAQTDVSVSMQKPYLDTASNILGTVNMLFLSQKYGVKRFIFASSAAVYGNSENTPLKEDEPLNPLSPYGMSKMTGELYCRKWFEIYGLSTLSLRFSNVYGPRQGVSGEGGVISVFIKRLISGSELVVFGNGRQTRDFIYVRDVAEGIYHCTHGSFTGVLNLSTCSEVSLNAVVDTLRSVYTVKNVRYTQPRPGDIFRSSLDNRQLKELVKWSPHYSFERGINETLNWFIENQAN
jgi:UDP-glucuronate decarboxylase